MPRTDLYDIESPLRTLSTLSKHNKNLFMFSSIRIIYDNLFYYRNNTNKRR